MSLYKGCELVEGGLYKVTFDFLRNNYQAYVIAVHLYNELDFPVWKVLASPWPLNLNSSSMQWSHHKIIEIEQVEVTDLPLFLELNLTDKFLSLLNGEYHG